MWTAEQRKSASSPSRASTSSRLARNRSQPCHSSEVTSQWGLSFFVQSNRWYLRGLIAPRYRD